MLEMMKKLRTQMRWIMLAIVVFFLLSTFWMYERRGGRRGPVQSPDGTMMDYEVAEVNGRILMRSELEARLRNYLENYGRSDAVSLDIPALYQSIFNQYVLEVQLADEVRAQGITVSDAEAEQAMKDYADQAFPTREAFYQALARSGVRVEDYKRSLARQMANERLLRSAIGEAVVSEDEALRFYRTPEGFKVCLANFAASQDAEALRVRLAAGEGWETATSDDVLASCDVLSVTREPIFLPNSAFASGSLLALDSLDVGQVSPVFQVASDDYAVGLKTEKVSEDVRSYDEVSADIRLLLRQQQERQNLADFERSLMEQARVTIHDPSIFPQPASEDAPEVSPQPGESPDVTSSEASASFTPAATDIA